MAQGTITLDTFKRAFNMTAEGTFKTDVAHTKGQFYLDKNGGLKSANRHFDLVKLNDTENNYRTRMALLTAFEGSNASGVFIERVREQLGLSPNKSIDGENVADKPLSRREVKQLITSFEQEAAAARSKPELERYFTLGTAKADDSDLEFETVSTVGLTHHASSKAYENLPPRLYSTCRAYSISIENMARAYELERATSGMSPDQIMEKLAKDRDKMPMVRLAHNPQFLMDETSYREGKALCEKQQAQKIGFKFSDLNEWALSEASRLSKTCCKSILDDTDLKNKNAALLKKFGLKPGSKAAALVADRLNAFSALAGRDKLTTQLSVQVGYYIGPAGDKATLLKRHVIPHPQPLPVDFAVEKLIGSAFIDAVLAAIDEENLDDDQKAVFLSRVFSKMASSSDGLHEIKDEKQLKLRLAEFAQEAKTVCEVFQDEEMRVDFCKTMNREITSPDFRGKPMKREEIVTLKKMVNDYRAWAEEMKSAEKAFDTGDLKNLVATLYKHHDVQLRFSGMNDIALFMAKLAGVFKPNGENDVFAPLRDSTKYTGLLTTLFNEFAENHSQDITLQKQAVREGKGETGALAVRDDNVKVVSQLRADAIEMNRTGGLFKNLIDTVLQPDDEFEMMDNEALIASQSIVMADGGVTEEMSDMNFPGFSDGANIKCTFNHTYDIVKGCEGALKRYES